MARKKKVKRKEKTDYKYNLKEYLSFLAKYKLLFIFLLFIGLLVEASQAVDKFLFKVIVDKGTEFANGTLLKATFIHTLIILAIIFGILLFFKLLFHWVQVHLINRLEANMIFDLKRKYFNHLLSLSYSFHTSHKTGSLISRLTRSSGAMERMTDVLVFSMAPLVFSMIVVFSSLAYFSFAPAIVVLVTVIAFISYSFLIQQKQRKYNIEANRAEDREKGNIADFFTNIDAIKYFGKEKLASKKFRHLSRLTKLAFLRTWDFWKWLDSGQTLILGIGTFFLILFPILQFLDGEISLGTIVFIYTIYGNIFWPLFSFVHGIRNYYRSMADFDALFQYGKIENEVKEKPNAKNLKLKEGKIEFKDISFQYGKRVLFEGFNLKIPAKKKIALVGHSGCGKTTLIKLLYRFYDPQLGAILIDNKNIKDFTKESLREEMSIVPQEPILFDDTIYNNVKFSKPGATREEVMRAIKFAQLDKLIEKLPKKEKTIVGERGIKLSAGEKQRVSIARALLANKKILILDEATSALDSKTEYEIQRDLEKLMKNRTSIIIAHRLSTIMKADKIVVMKKGSIVQKGTHNQLIRQEGEYKKLWNLQKGGYIK